MSLPERFASCLAQCPLVAILRGITPAEIPAVCDALSEAGIRLLEVPLNSQDACVSIRTAVQHCGERQIVGAGTVLSAAEVRQVQAAGGSFIISPNTEVEVIQESKRLGLISIPGFFTATEGFAALKAGADYLKLFPAILGPGYVKDLQAVIKAPILAVGGVNADNLVGFLRVCAGAGVGSAIYQPGKALADIARDARLLAEKCR